MIIYSVVVDDAQDNALRVVAKKDGISVEELVQKQIDYYISNVISSYVDAPVDLTKEQTDDLNSLLALTKANFISEVKAVKEGA